MRRSLTFERLDDLKLVVSCQTHQPPTDSEWDGYLAMLLELPDRGAQHRFLIITEGGHPSRQQQHRLHAIVQDTRAKVAVVTASTVVHFVISVMTLLNPRMRSFLPVSLDAALEYLQLEAHQVPIVHTAIARLRERLGRNTSAAA